MRLLSHIAAMLALLIGAGAPAGADPLAIDTIAAKIAHLQVFALDIPLDLAPGADRVRVLNAMRGHELAAGEIVAPFGQPKA